MKAKPSDRPRCAWVIPGMTTQQLIDEKQHLSRLHFKGDLNEEEYNSMVAAYEGEILSRARKCVLGKA